MLVNRENKNREHFPLYGTPFTLNVVLPTEYSHTQTP